MVIRNAIPGDVAALAKVHIESWRSAYRGLVPDSHLGCLDYERRAQQFLEMLTHNAEETYIVDQDREVLGFLTLGGSRDLDMDQQTTGEIWGIYLAPEQWRNGIGTSLCRYGEGILKIKGYRIATLWVFAGNIQARKFYEAMGFIADGASKMLNPGAPLEAVRYRKELREVEQASAPDCHSAALHCNR